MTPADLAKRLAAIPPKVWADALDSNDEGRAWRAIAEALLAELERAKCATCRCSVVKGQVCGCCAKPPSEEPFI